MTNLIYTTMDSPIGELLLVGDGQALHRLQMQEGRRPVPIDPSWERRDDAFDDVRAQLQEYFDGRRREFDVSLALHGNEFERRRVAARSAGSRTARRSATARSRARSTRRAPPARSGSPTAATRSR